MDKPAEALRGRTDSKKPAHRDNLSTEITRRHAILTGAKAALLAAAGIFGGKLGRRSYPSDEEAVAEIEPLPKPESTPIHLEGELVEAGGRTGEGVKAPDVKVENDTEYKFYSHYTKTELENLKKRIEEQEDLLNSEPGVEESLDRSRDKKGLVDKVLANYEFSQRFRESEIPKLMAGLIFTESRGQSNPDPPSAAGAKGLCQIMPDAEELVRNKLGLAEGKYKILDDETNVRFAMTYLDLLYGYFREEGITIWAYHLGQGRMAVVIGNMIGETVGDSVDEREIFLQKCPEIVRENNLNFENLIESPYVQNEIVGKEAYDKTWIYFPSAVAASRRMAA